MKQSDKQLDSGLKYFLERVKIPHAFQVSGFGNGDQTISEIGGCKVHLMPVSQFLSNLV